MTYKEVFSFKNLYTAYRKCIHGVRWKAETQRFVNRDLLLIHNLYLELKYKRYIPNKFKEFDIIERGKPRHISAHTIRDRVVQRCLCDNFLVPLLSKSLIYDCGATIKGKGITFSQNRVNTHLHQYYRKYGNKGYCLTLDIHHYFDSISHKILKEKLSKVVEDKDIEKLLFSLIDLFPNEYGLGLGSQISQICALYYLNDLDHFIKEKLRCHFYARYMDDSYIIANNKEELYDCLKRITLEINKIGLTFNNKTKIHKLENGFIFTKIKYVLTDSGKILHFITTKTFKVMKRKIKIGVDLDGVLPSWYAYLDKFDCHNKLQKFKNLYIY